ncbi:hypothetical protein [Stutzerimonas stutzeri]|uniref:hypothetical protein n=1 Tax=Stutzerimonas stutzeri TaxID=316 RepID=UPI001093E365|nr:hypothetical protein [Stutzerimonas stutzeri]MBA1184139.1 hypothetical protein [Stutzerimonas stutzeri]TGY09480.1 hypothetical protein E5834_20115 [Stutzerimonas stutzeri]
MPKRLIARFLGSLGRWAVSIEKRLTPPTASEAFKKRLAKWRQLWFVVDIPLFIDSQAIEKLHDALSRPEFETTSRKQSSTAARSKEFQDDLTLSGETGLAPFMKASTSAKFSQKRSTSNSQTLDLNQEANRSTEMRFEKIINFYAHNYPERIFWAENDLSKVIDTNGNSLTWQEVSTLIAEPAPRPLIVFDLSKGSKLIAMAAENTKGELKEIYKDYIRELPNGDQIPTYSSAPENSKSYWEKLEEHFNPTIAMRSVENSTKDGTRIDWIDYRLISKAANTVISIHLHLSPKGEYNTGTFAYQTVRRGFKYGIKIVGTLKQGEDVNVLAIYEN